MFVLVREAGGGGRLGGVGGRGGGGVAVQYLRHQTVFPQMALCMHRLWQHICVIRGIFDNTCEQTGGVCFNASSGLTTGVRQRKNFSIFFCLQQHHSGGAADYCTPHLDTI